MRLFLSGRTRLVDGLLVAAVALLALKGIGLLAAPSDPETGPDGLPRFARVLGFARSNYLPADPATTGSVPDKPKAAPAAEPAAAGRPSGSPSERSILERLGERREELQQRARDIEAREKLLDEAERRLDAKAVDAKPPDDAPARAATPADDQEAAALKGLVTMYETMKPKDAARVFERLPHDVLVPVVRLIAPRKMAEILAGMSSESAEKLTVALARRQGAPDGRSAAASALPSTELQAVELPARPPRPRR